MNQPTLYCASCDVVWDCVSSICQGCGGNAFKTEVTRDASEMLNHLFIRWDEATKEYQVASDKINGLRVWYSSKDRGLCDLFICKMEFPLTVHML